ncbi:methylenetetrahydrofolate reductase [Hwanghaeella sp.]|uniref:methylenetetrahydrofolate reductase n=1 Tax=Hwanghaeella sp. TaxID=2605943 RepID=UPI003CCC04BF
MTELKLSFEYFPARTEKAAATLRRSAAQLDALGPRFASVTYGALGSDTEASLHTIKDVQSVTASPVAAHLTCSGATREEIHATAERFWEMGVRALVALRGDAAEDKDAIRAYDHASGFVAALKQRHGFEVNVAAFPEGHPETSGPGIDGQGRDIENLKRKADAGADRALCQFCFDDDAFLRYRDRAAGAGIGLEVVPGFLPILNFRRLEDFAGKCGGTLPQALRDRFAGHEDDAEATRRIAVEVGAEQIERLRAAGVDGFHVFTLNKAGLTLDIFRAAGIETDSRKPGGRIAA